MGETKKKARLDESRKRKNAAQSDALLCPVLRLVWAGNLTAYQ